MEIDSLQAVKKYVQRKQLDQLLDLTRSIFQIYTLKLISLSVQMKANTASRQCLIDGYVDVEQVKKALRGVKVEVTHRRNMRRKYRISGLTSQPTRELMYLSFT